MDPQWQRLALAVSENLLDEDFTRDQEIAEKQKVIAELEKRNAQAKKVRIPESASSLLFHARLSHDCNHANFPSTSPGTQWMNHSAKSPWTTSANSLHTSNGRSMQPPPIPDSLQPHHWATDPCKPSWMR
jgi:hypothetical protein